MLVITAFSLESFLTNVITEQHPIASTFVTYAYALVKTSPKATRGKSPRIKTSVDISKQI